MKFLIAGFGSIGRRHFQNLLTLGERDILFYRTHHSTLADDELVGFRVETDLRAALSHKPDVVIVANPTAFHLDIAIPAAEMGCHVLIEKPVSHSINRVDELITAVQRGGGKVLVGYQFRFHPALQLIARWLSTNHINSQVMPQQTRDPESLILNLRPPIYQQTQSIHHSTISNPIGRPLSFHVHWGEYLPAWHPWEDYRHGYSARSDLGGGVILTLSHPIDYLRWFFGEVSQVWAFTEHLGDLDIQTEDTAEIGLRFTSGIVGSIHLDYNQQPASHRLEIVGNQGTIRWDNEDGALHLYKANSFEKSEGSIERGYWEVYKLPPGFERNQMFMTEMQYFLSLIHGEVGPFCTLEDGISALHLALAAKRSAQKKEIVTVSGGTL